MIGNLQSNGRRRRRRRGQRRSIAQWWNALLSRPVVATEAPKSVLLKERLLGNAPWALSLAVNACVVLAVGLYAIPQVQVSMKDVMEVTLDGFLTPTPTQPKPPIDDGGGVGAALPAFVAPSTTAPVIPPTVITAAVPTMLAFNIPKSGPQPTMMTKPTGTAGVTGAGTGGSGTGTGAGVGAGGGGRKGTKVYPQRTSALIIIELEDDFVLMDKGVKKVADLNRKRPENLTIFQINMFAQVVPKYRLTLYSQKNRIGERPYRNSINYTASKLRELAFGKEMKKWIGDRSIDEAIMWLTSLNTEPTPEDIEAMKAFLLERELNFHLVITSDKEPSPALLDLVQATGGTCRKFDEKASDIYIPRNPKIYARDGEPVPAPDGQNQ